LLFFRFFPSFVRFIFSPDFDIHNLLSILDFSKLLYYKYLSIVSCEILTDKDIKQEYTH